MDCIYSSILDQWWIFMEGDCLFAQLKEFSWWTPMVEQSIPFESLQLLLTGLKRRVDPAPPCARRHPLHYLLLLLGPTGKGKLLMVQLTFLFLSFGQSDLTIPDVRPQPHLFRSQPVPAHHYCQLGCSEVQKHCFKTHSSSSSHTLSIALFLGV